MGTQQTMMDAAQYVMLNACGIALQPWDKIQLALQLVETLIFRHQIVKLVTMEIWSLETDVGMSVLLNRAGVVQMLLEFNQHVRSYVVTLNMKLLTQKHVTMETK